MFMQMIVRLFLDTQLQVSKNEPVVCVHTSLDSLYKFQGETLSTLTVPDYLSSVVRKKHPFVSGSSQEASLFIHLSILI